MASNDTKDRENLNPADNYWSDGNVFQGDAKSNRLKNAEEEAASDNSDNTNNPEDELSNINDAKNLEESSGIKYPGIGQSRGGYKFNPKGKGISSGITGKAKLLLQAKNLLNKKGPIGLIIAILTTTGIFSFSLFTTPAYWWASVKSNITNVRDMAGPARNMRFSRIIERQIPRNNRSLAEVNEACKKPKSHKCRGATISERMKKRLEKAGIEIDAEKHDKSGRYHIKSMTITDDMGREHKITNRSEFRNAFRKPGLRSIFNRGFDGAKSLFFSNKFKNVLSKRFKTSKISKLTGKDKKSMDASFRKGMKLEGEPANGDRKKRQENKEKQTKKIKKHTDKIKQELKHLGPLGILCNAYDGAKSITSAAKMVQIANLVRFAMIFFTEFDKAIAGDATPESNQYIGDRLNYNEFNKTDSDGKINRFYNTTFTDSEGMRMLLHGDIRNLSDHAEKYVVGGGLVGQINGVVSKIENTVGGGPFSSDSGEKGPIRNVLSKVTGRSLSTPTDTGRMIMSELCLAIDKAGAIGEIRQCSTTLGKPLAAAGAAFAGVGAIAGYALSVGLCTAIVGAANLIMDEIINSLMQKVLKWVVDWVAGMNLDEETKGFDAGNAIASGAGFLMQNTAQTNGLVATDKTGYKNYLANVSSEYSEYIASLRHEARNTPFDGSNQYSFLGSIITSMQSMRGMGAREIHPVSFLQNTLALIPLGAQKLVAATPTASALSGSFGAIPEFDEREAKCKDPTLTDSFSGDPFCVPYVHMDKTALTIDPNTVTDYMVNNDFIDEEGTIKNSDHGKILKNFNKFCVTRTMPPGELDPGGSEDGAIKGAADDVESANSDKKDPGYSQAQENISQDSLQLNTQDGYTFRERMMLDDWRSGYNCSKPNEAAGTNKEMLAMLSAYTMDNSIYDDMDDKEAKSPANHEIGDGGSGDWARPTTGPCLSGFGQRWGTLHAGLDISPPAGTPILAPTKMKIISASDKGDGYGNSVVARQEGGEGYMFRFGHAMELKVREGETVERGAVIATVGATGYVTGPHLHFEIYPKDAPDGAYASNGSPMDPYPKLKEHGVDVGACSPN